MEKLQVRVNTIVDCPRMFSQHEPEGPEMLKAIEEVQQSLKLMGAMRDIAENNSTDDPEEAWKVVSLGSALNFPTAKTFLEQNMEEPPLKECNGFIHYLKV